MNEHSAPAVPLTSRVLGATPTERLVRYTKFSFVFLPPTAWLIQAAPLWAQRADIPLWRTVVCIAATALACLVAGLLTNAALAGTRPGQTTERTRRLGWLAWGLTGAAALLPALFLPVAVTRSWGSAPVSAMLAVAGPLSLLLCLLTGRQANLVLAMAVLAPGVIALLRGLDPLMLTLVGFAPALYLVAMGWTGRLTAWMLGVIRALDEARQTNARLAVAEERLRFSRDLHDIVGRGLSAIALKSQLAAELSRRDRHEQSREEMDAVHRLAQEQLAEIRAVVAGYRKADLQAELAGAQRLLESAGARVTVTGTERLDAISAASQEALAWTVREAVTNIVRHSAATRCRIALEAGRQARITISNDGAHPRTGGASGSGLAGLAERLNGVGGHLEVRQEGKDFLLIASVPLDAPDTAVGAE
ncbi:sensor histidine kinase [Luteococcus sp. Sow4_B9]|uniref:sensor histidine kinase n=1 Tax=Luteococcus sp. Sow4_B9 TaxID=3438792 RepID=UPI003F96E418